MARPNVGKGGSGQRLTPDMVAKRQKVATAFLAARDEVRATLAVLDKKKYWDQPNAQARAYWEEVEENLTEWAAILNQSASEKSVFE